MAKYINHREWSSNYRIPLRCSIDLTYRCNNNCRHCWLWLPSNASEEKEELTFDEIRRIALEARALGTREWDISGGEALLRPDFTEIFDYLTSEFRTYTLRTNGTLITPQIAKLMKRPGAKWISLYGATEEVYDRITRNPGGFEQLMRNFALLKEAGVHFTVQIFPMRENWHQWSQMMALAHSLSSEIRVGAAWLHLSANGDPQRNREIINQRLDPSDVIAVDPPYIEGEEKITDCCINPSKDNRLFRECIRKAQEFHIDAYGKMSFCLAIKEPALRYDLKKGTVREGWEVFIPSLADKLTGSDKYRDGCAQCDLKEDCRWCASYAWLEHHDFSEKIDYLCNIAREKKRYKENWKLNHRKYFSIAGITIQVDSELPIKESTFSPAIRTFAVDEPGDDVVKIHHYFSLKGVSLQNLGNEVYHNTPWTIYRKEKSWIYRCGKEDSVFSVSAFTEDHGRGRIHHYNEGFWHKGNLNTISVPPTDQILLVRLLAERQGCIIHSAGAILNSKGLLFVGHSDAGKTTTTRLLEGHAEILCDDRNIIRMKDHQFMLYGSWSHGESSLVSAASVPLHALLFLRQSSNNKITPITDKKAILHRLLPCLVRGATDHHWWKKTIDFVVKISTGVPCFEMEFNKSGDILSLLKKL